ncbi:Smr/MutS family endonuclease [Candidatus Cyrtobacter comes]|uniref:Smr/MutS family endonuclease n=1 Tax=Candidatus Cyrtobacter comes TaxID=675776 RepID=A0ABU5L8P4_9RICK|nr:hypothetical protein [Candidatus Cyrtobacter comes]MDZ5762497.1 Smr/MutS family endonuclease [Candidatus Cyrtobacter comes]
MQKESWEHFFENVKPLKTPTDNHCINEFSVAHHITRKVTFVKQNEFDNTKVEDVSLNKRSIDLHDHTISQAYEALCLFFKRYKSCSGALIVITGKGSRTGEESIKDSFIKWSRHGTLSKLFTQIIPIKDCRGQVGSFKVFLKKNQKEII